MDSRFFLTLQALRRQLAAMPCDFYLIRLIHRHTRKALPGDRVWTAPQVLYGRTVSFLRARNREGNDVYFQPYAFQRNAGYILVELDRADPAVLDTMRANGHQPCVVVETSPGGSVASFEKGANEGLGSHGHHAVVSNRLAMNRICLTS